MTNTVLSTIGIENLVSLIADEVVKKLSRQPELNQEKLFCIDDAMAFTDLSKQTIYNKVARREIPHQRKNGRLYFSSTELTEWIKSGKRKTNEEIKADAQSYLKRKGLTMDNHRNPSISFGSTKDKQLLITSIRQTLEKALNKSFSQLRKENAEDNLYYLGLRYVTTTNKAICQALDIPVEAGTRYKRTLEKAGLLVHSIDEVVCPYTFHKSHLLSTNPKEFAKLQKTSSKQLNLFEKRG